MEPGPHAYDPPYETRTETAAISAVGVNRAFLADKHGILKIIEIVLTIIVFICVGSSWYYGHTGSGGWINFTAAMSLICSVTFFILYLFNLIHKLPGPWVLIDFSVQIVNCVLMAISMIVAAASSHFGSSAIAAAVFCAFLSVAYALECILRFTVSRTGNQCVVTMRTVSVRETPFVGATHTASAPAPTGPPPYPTDSYGMP